jgi:cobalt-zinc-cadmium efflux system outer membrane protein
MRTVVAIAALLVGGGAAAAEGPLTVERAVALALERNPEISAREAGLRAARARLEGARLPFQANPEVAIAAGPRSRGGERSTDVDIELSQRVELFGQRGARIDAARAEAAAAEGALAQRRAEIAAQTRIAFARALAAERLAAIAEEDLALSREAARVAEKRLELGDGSRLELNAARVEVGRAARGVALARQAVDAARAELRLVTGTPAGAALRLAGDLAPAGRGGAAPEALVERALAGRGDLAAARHEVDAARAEVRFAAREWLPLPRLGAGFKREEGADIVVGTVAFDLPVWNRNPAGRGTASARLSRAESELGAAERRVREEVLLAARRVAAAREAAQAFDADVVGATKENLALTTQAYQSGKLDLVQVLLIRRSAIEARRGEVEALAALAEAEAELARVSGATVDEWKELQREDEFLDGETAP